VYECGGIEGNIIVQDVHCVGHLITPPNYKGYGVKIILSAGSNTMHILGDNISPQYHHIYTWGLSSPIPVHMKTQIPLDTKHTSPKKMLSGHQHSKSNTVYALTCPCVW
jgi:hypothetical protein